MARPKPTIYQFALNRFDRAIGRSRPDPEEERLMGKLRKLSTVKRATTTQEALALLKENSAPKAICITDSDILAPGNDALSQQIVASAREHGTTVVLCLNFVRINYLAFESWMQSAWNLPWKAHSYCRETCVINPDAKGPPGTGPYSQSGDWMRGLMALHPAKSNYLAGVSPSACWYKPLYAEMDWANFDIDNPPPRMRVAPDDFSYTPAAFEAVGKGFLGYVGEINRLEETDAIVLSMLGLNLELEASCWCVCGQRGVGGGDLAGESGVHLFRAIMGEEDYEDDDDEEEDATDEDSAMGDMEEE